MRIVLAVADSPTEAQAWRDWLGGTVPAAEVTEAYATDEVVAKANDADLVLLGQGLSGLSPLEQVIHDLRQRTAARIILLTVELGDLTREPTSPDMRRARELAAYAVSNAVFDVVPATPNGVDEELLRLRLDTPAAWEDAKFLRAVAVVPVAQGGTHLKAPKVQVVEKLEIVQTERTISRRRPNRLLVVVFSPGGGVGKSTVAVHLGTWIAGSGLPVCLLELDEDKPGLARWFGMDPPHRGLDDLEGELFDPDEIRGGESLREALRGITMRVGKNLALVPVKGRLAGLQIKDKGAMNNLLDTLLQEYAVVIADCPVRFKDVPVFYSMRRADHIVLVADQNKAVLDALVRHMEDSRNFGLQTDRYMLAVNGYLENVGLSVRQIEEALGLPAAVVIPNEPVAYKRELNLGKVSVEDGSVWARLGEKLTIWETEDEQVTHRPARVAAGGGFLARIFRRNK